jgi:uncharacterized protein YegJ (DUF2314 family)
VAAYRRFPSLMVLVALASCSDAERGLHETKRVGEPTVYEVRAKDADMNAAMMQARATIAQFRQRLTAPPITQSYIALKVRFGSGDSVEHIWIDDVELMGEQFRGIIGTEPVEASTPALGESVLVPLQQVSDWMAIDNGRLVGGYTLQVLRNHMSTDQRAEFDASLGFTID